MKLERIHNKFTEIWHSLEKKSPKPLLARKLIVVDYKKFEEQVFHGSFQTRKKIAQSLYKGDVYLLKKALNKKFCEKLIKGAWKINKKEKKGFYKIKENCPNFHRLIDYKITKKYSSNHIKHAFYFFPWNKDPINMYKKIYKKWRLFKFLGGFKARCSMKKIPLKMELLIAFKLCTTQQVQVG